VTYNEQYDIFTVGAGYLDIQAVLRNTDLASLPAKSPVAQFDTTMQEVYLVSDSSAVWEAPQYGVVAPYGAAAYSPGASPPFGVARQCGRLRCLGR
jgi:hypothetical protein